jgi:small-conductance mechanosensitive channel
MSNPYSAVSLAANLLGLPIAAVVVLIVLRQLALMLALRRMEDPQRRSRRRRVSSYALVILAVVAVTEIWRANVKRFTIALGPGTWRALNRTQEEVEQGLAGLIDALIITIVLAVLLKLIWRGHRWLVARANRWAAATEAIRYQQAVVLRAERIRHALLHAAQAARVLLAALLFYLYIPLLVSRFPRGAPIARAAKPYVLKPFLTVGGAIVGYLPNLLILALIVLGVHYLLKLVRFVMKSIERGDITLPGFDADWADPTYKMLRAFVVLLALIVGYPYLPGAGSKVFEGFSLLVGAIVTLSSSSAVANIISGIILTYTRSFRVGDRVLIGDTLGDVVEKRLFLTRLRTITQEEVTIPNSVVLGGRVTNLSAAERNGGLLVTASVGIAYDVDWRKVHELLKAAAAKTAGIIPEPVPCVLQTELGNFAVNYTLFAATPNAKRARFTASELRQNILDVFNQAGVEIMTPSMAGVRDASQPAIPAEYNPKASTAAGLRIVPLERTGRG